MPGQVLARRLPMEHPRRSGEEPDLVDHRRDLLVPGQADRFAGVLRLEGDQLLGVGLQRVGDADEGQAALGGRGVAPAVERLGCGPSGGVDVGTGRHRRLGELLAGDRVDERRGPALDRVPQLAVDEVLDRAHGAA